MNGLAKLMTTHQRNVLLWDRLQWQARLAGAKLSTAGLLCVLHFINSKF
jgi:hypothetical protein